MLDGKINAAAIFPWSSVPSPPTLSSTVHLNCSNQPFPSSFFHLPGNQTHPLHYVPLHPITPTSSYYIWICMLSMCESQCIVAVTLFTWDVGDPDHLLCGAMTHDTCRVTLGHLLSQLDLPCRVVVGWSGKDESQVHCPECTGGRRDMIATYKAHAHCVESKPMKNLLPTKMWVKLQTA